LKLIKPTVAYISKEECNPAYEKPEIIDVRVPMGHEQSKLYAHFLDRAHIPCKHALTRARKQTAWLRNVCADPEGFTHGGPAVSSNMNPKTIAILELTRDMLGEGEQVTIICARVGQTNTLQQMLVVAFFALARIDFTVPVAQLSAQANLFKSGMARVMLMGIKCAAAHSFSQCKYEIIASLEYSFGPFEQAKGRVDRVNSRPGVKVFVILHKDSLEELQFETVALKGDAAVICLRGQRLPRDFKPVEIGELLAKSMERFDVSGSTPESECEAEWPKLRDAITKSLLTEPASVVLP